MIDEYSIDIEVTDTHVAFDCEADRAKREGIRGVEKRQRAMALHIRNAEAVMTGLCPPDYRLRARIVFDIVPDVNPVLTDKARWTRAPKASWLDDHVGDA